jgi:hypothetical protein
LPASIGLVMWFIVCFFGFWSRLRAARRVTTREKGAHQPAGASSPASLDGLDALGAGRSRIRGRSAFFRNGHTSRSGTAAPAAAADGPRSTPEQPSNARALGASWAMRTPPVVVSLG